jgi:hypothetical protein
MADNVRDSSLWGRNPRSDRLDRADPEHFDQRLRHCAHRGIAAAGCLAGLELAVNWEAEKLYGVEGLGPFDEF